MGDGAQGRHQERGHERGHAAGRRRLRVASAREVQHREGHRRLRQEGVRQEVQPTWHCIVGRNFGSYVTHETKHFIYFYLGQVAGGGWVCGEGMMAAVFRRRFWFPSTRKKVAKEFVPRFSILLMLGVCWLFDQT